jgi:magnesium chelatase family protein
VIARLVPADLPKDGAHFDLPIALALMVAIGAAPQDALEFGIAFGEQTLDGAPAASPTPAPARRILAPA